MKCSQYNKQKKGEKMKPFKEKIKKMVAGTMLIGALYTAKPAIAQEKKEKPKTQPKAVLVLSPTYSTKGEYGAFRISGGGKAYGIGIGGFLDLYGTKESPTDMQSHFGKVTASKSLDSIVKGSGMAVELTTMSSGKDQVRAGIYKTGKLLGFSYKGQLYPIAPKGKGPSAGLFLSKKLAPKLDVSAFLTSDLGAKTYYGEAKIAYKIGKKLSIIMQERYGGKFGGKFKPETHLGIEIKL